MMIFLSPLILNDNNNDDTKDYIDRKETLYKLWCLSEDYDDDFSSL